MNPTKISAACEKHIKGFESCSLRAYPDPSSELSKAMSKRGVLNSFMAGKSGIPADLAKLSGHPWTIGWGHTGKEVFPGLVWTQEQCDKQFWLDIGPYEMTARNAIGVSVTQGQFDAVVDMIYNVGPGSSTRDGICRLKDGRPSSFMRKLNSQDYAGAAKAILDWIYAGGVKMAGLERRRLACKAMFEAKPS